MSEIEWEQNMARLEELWCEPPALELPINEDGEAHRPHQFGFFRVLPDKVVSEFDVHADR